MSISPESYISVKYRGQLFAPTCLDLYGMINTVEYPEQILVQGIRNEYSKIESININYCSEQYMVTSHSGKIINVSSDQIIPVVQRGAIKLVAAESIPEYTTMLNSSNYFDINTSSKDFIFGQFLGILLGDGGLTQKHYLTVAINYEQTFISDFLNDFFDKDLKHFNNMPSSVKLNAGHRCYAYTICGTKFADEVRRLFSGKDTYTKHLRNAKIYPLDYFIGVLDGLMVTDGTYNESLCLTLCNHNIISQVQNILQMLGIHRSIIPHNDKRKNRHVTYKLNIPLYLSKYLPLLSKKIPNDRPRRLPVESHYYGPDAYVGQYNCAHKKNILRHNANKIHDDIKKPYSDMTDVVRLSQNGAKSNLNFSIKTESKFLCANSVLLYND